MSTSNQYIINLKYIAMSTGIDYWKLYNFLRGKYNSLKEEEKKKITDCIDSETKIFKDRLNS